MLSKLPQGYKVAHHTATDTGTILELIPENETLPEWTEMLTVRILRNTNGWMLAGFRQVLSELWAETYPGGTSELIERGTEQFRPTLMWSLTCPHNKYTRKPENTWFKAVIREGNVIVVQKAFKFAPSAHAVAFWIAMRGTPTPALKSASVRASSHGHPCRR
jgi:hypothetical protein